MSSYSLKFHRLTIAISTSGTMKNSRNTSAKGAACHHARMLRTGVAAWAGAVVAMALMASEGSSGDELVPLADHVLVFVHDRVPASDAAHALLVAATVAHGTGLGNHV